MYLSSDDPAGWLEWRLDEKQQLPVNTSAPLLDMYKSVRYRQHAGVAIKVHSAYGLPGLYIDEQISMQTFVVLSVCTYLFTFNIQILFILQKDYTHNVSCEFYRVETHRSLPLRRRAGAQTRSSSL